MIMTKTPFRVSFFGGGTDMPMYYHEYGGRCISTAIDKFAYVNTRHLSDYFDYNNEIVYSKIEQVKNEMDIVHPLVRNTMLMLQMHQLRITYDADLPARTGLGTSSTFAVGLINAFCALKGKEKTKKELADYAIFVERVLCKEAGGLQDQIAASFGDFNLLSFKKDAKAYEEDLSNMSTDELIDLCKSDKIYYDRHIKRNDYEVQKISISKDRKKELFENLILCFTGISRNSFEVQSNTQKNLNNKIKELSRMNELIDEALDILTTNKDLNEFGKLLNTTWLLKRELAQGITNTNIDDIYNKAIESGALGGKLLGAGGGGFLLFYVEKDKQEFFNKKMSGLTKVPIACDELGTELLYNVPETWQIK